MKNLVIATHNEGKVREFDELFGPLGIRTLSGGSLQISEPEETGTTFAANARIKSENAASELAAKKLSDHYALADDSGLQVEGLDGAPGVYSARWAGPSKDYPAAFARIKQELEAKGLNPEGAPASFICTLALTRAADETVFFEGEVKGRLTFPPRGSNGFGYDSIFVPEDHTKTFAEMDAAAKHAVSHRARALAKFVSYVNGLKVGENA